MTRNNARDDARDKLIDATPDISPLARKNLILMLSEKEGGMIDYINGSVERFSFVSFWYIPENGLIRYFGEPDERLSSFFKLEGDHWGLVELDKRICDIKRNDGGFVAELPKIIGYYLADFVENIPEQEAITEHGAANIEEAVNRYRAIVADRRRGKY